MTSINTQENSAQNESMFDLQELLVCKNATAMQNMAHNLFVYIKGQIYPEAHISF